ncbi:sialidase family protein [Anditalea andensis]|uniref:Sialidase n=1 Tax=Anditalea andensis TaxID=1048983 RepID=A0A074KWF7_9BACT|nr:sialidase family protein [Anditalea andensis]KEO74316.1 sialidase [Anditalea andensis]
MIQEYIYNEATFPSAHASSIAETPEGLIATWFGGTHEGHEDVEIWISRKIDGLWTAPISVANGLQHPDKRFPVWNPVLFQAPDGLLFLYYKVGPEPQKWWGMVISSHDHGLTWSEPSRLPEGVFGPIKNKPELLSNGTLINPSSTEHDGWKVHFELSEDLGKTWQIVHLPEDKGLSAIQPSILQYEDGRLQMLARSKEGYLVSSWSKDMGKRWERLAQTSLPNPNSGTDAVTLNNGWQLLVYNHAVKSEDLWGGLRSPLNVAVSQDGLNWRALVVLEDQPGEFSYPAVIQAKDGTVHITYTWNREKIKHVGLNITDIDLLVLKEIKDGKWPL